MLLIKEHSKTKGWRGAEYHTLPVCKPSHTWTAHSMGCFKETCSSDCVFQTQWSPLKYVQLCPNSQCIAWFLKSLSILLLNSKGLSFHLAPKPMWTLKNCGVFLWYWTPILSFSFSLLSFFLCALLLLVQISVKPKLRPEGANSEYSLKWKKAENQRHDA